MVSTRNRLNFSGWWILNELTQNSKALLGTPLQSPSRLSQKHSLGRCHASRPCDLWHDKQKAAKVRTHMEGTKLNNQRNHVKSSNPQGTVLNSCREFNIPVFRCRARRREYPSLSLNSPTWVSHWSSPRRWKRSRPVCWMRERSFTCRRAQGRRDGTRSWVVQTDSETCLAPKNPKEKKVLKLVSCSGS